MPNKKVLELQVLGLKWFKVHRSSFQPFLLGKRVLDHQVFVLKGQINVDLVFNSFVQRNDGVGAQKVGVERRKYKDYQFSKHNLVFKNQKLVFNHEQKTAS